MMCSCAVKKLLTHPGFLITGVTNASLNADGKRPAASDRLNSAVRNGATSSATCFSTDTDNKADDTNKTK